MSSADLIAIIVETIFSVITEWSNSVIFILDVILIDWPTLNVSYKCHLCHWWQSMVRWNAICADEISTINNCFWNIVWIDFRHTRVRDIYTILRVRARVRVCIFGWVSVYHKSNVELWTNVIDFDEIIVILTFNKSLMVSLHIVTEYRILIFSIHHIVFMFYVSCCVNVLIICLLLLLLLFVT